MSNAGAVQIQQDEEWFADLVYRELWGNASEEESTYLWSSQETIDRWRRELVRLMQKSENLRGSLKVEREREYEKFFTKGKSAAGHPTWRAYEQEIKQKLGNNRIFLRTIHHRLLLIKTYKQTTQVDPLALESMYREGCIDGWLANLKTMRYLVNEEEKTLEEAFEICYTHWQATLTQWRTNVHMPPFGKPPGPHIRDESEGAL